MAEEECLLFTYSLRHYYYNFEITR